MIALDSLNEPQRAAVVHPGGPLVVFAGAGSGKTRVITYRVARLVADEGVRPWRILAVTFTNKAAAEMRARVETLLGGAGARDLWVGTFHATCARMLRKWAEPIGIRRDFTIYDSDDSRALVTRVLRDEQLDERRWAPRALAGAISRAKDGMKAPEDLPARTDPFGEVARRVYELYEKRLAAAGALDFGDLIYRLVRALEKDDALRTEIAGRFDHVLVDEYQDTNHAQYRLVRALVARHRNVCVVGDDDQSIYRWRGADRRNILDFQREMPDAAVVKLEQNYRSTQRILRAAHAVISRNHDREPKTMWTQNAEGGKILVLRCQDERDEARRIVAGVQQARAAGTRLTEAVVFYRTHALSRVIEEALRAAKIAYRIIGGVRFYDRAEVKDLLAYLRILHNPDDDVSVLRIVNVPARGIGKTTIERLMEAAARAGTGVWAAMTSPASDAILGGARKKLDPFVALVGELRTRLSAGASVHEIATEVLERSGYLQMLRDEDTPEADARLENLQELLGSIEEFDAEAEDATLARWLELVTLQTSADEGGEDEDKLTLMTVHAAKGLEFPLVFVAGLEEETFPLRPSEDEKEDEHYEEERRLAYVAFTRAEKQLVLSWAATRFLYGQTRVGIPSRFLDELPATDVERIGDARAPASGGGRTRWDNRDDFYEDDGGAGGWRSSSPVRRPAWAPKAAERTAPARSAESYVDRSDTGGDGATVRRGMRVRHAKYGVGTVRDVAAGVPPSVSVDFPGWGVKKIVATWLEPA